MTSSKVLTMMGFAARAGKINGGTNSAIYTIEKGKGKLLIMACDLAENTKEKLISKAKSKNVEYRVYGDSDDMAHITGMEGKSVFLITDTNFSKVIAEEIDKEVF